MQVYSMTGFASVLRGMPGNPNPSGGSQIHVEIRSVNGRFLDLGLRLCDEFRALEPVLREAVGRQIKRGKVELRLAVQSASEGTAVNLNAGVLSQLSRWQSQVQAALPLAPPLSVHDALHWCKGLNSDTSWDDEAVLALVQVALEQLVEARGREGARLAESLFERIAALRALADRAEPLIPAVVQRQQERFLERWREALRQTGGHADNASAQERALAEAASHAIRIDVAEELTRLRAHLDEIEAQLRKGGELGKRLDFLIQELHREANTLGSKSTALELSGISVDMKVLVEQMREQVQNIE